MKTAYRPRRDQAVRAIRQMTGKTLPAPPPVIRLVGLVIRDACDSTRNFDEISVRRVREDLARCEGAAEISLIIDSPGGNLETGYAVYDLLRSFPGRINGRVIGGCASSATVILLACDWREAVAGARFLIHQTTVDPTREWTANVHRKVASGLDVENEKLARFYGERLHRSVPEFRELMAAANPLTPARAVEIGLIHRVLAGAGRPHPLAR